MCDVITFSSMRELLCNVADVMHSNADYLTQLDVAVGDGDHGRNMALGFGYVCEEVSAMPPSPPGLLLRAAGMTLVAKVGGASGPLYGAAFIAAGITAGSREVITLDVLAEIVEAATGALVRRGRCRLGDKTILDAMAPASEAIARVARRKGKLLEALQEAAEEARRGMESTTSLVAHRGLAMQYGSASAGHQDPGATSCYLIFESALATFKRLCDCGQ